MVERLISFADPEAGLSGAVALEGERAAAVIAGLGEEAIVLDDAVATRGEGSLRVEGPAGLLVLGLAAQTTPLAFETDDGSSVELQSIGVSASVSPAGGDEDGFEAAGVSWALRGEGEARSVRALWALDEDGLFAMFGLRDGDSHEHGSETVGAVRIAGDGKVTAYDEPLLSTEYDAAGRQTRATLELWGADDGAADRGGGLRRAGGSGSVGDGRLEAAGFSWSLGGRTSFGTYEIFTA